MKKVRTTIVITFDVLEKLRQIKNITGLKMGEVAGEAITLHWEEIVKKHMDKVEREKLYSLTNIRRGLKLKLGQIEREMEDCKGRVK
jgi:hypothetical protein